MARKAKNEVTIALVREICDLLRKAMPWGVIAWLGWCGVLGLRALAGQLTVADIQFLTSIFTKLGSPAKAWALTLVAIVYAYLQRRERLRKTTYLQERIIALESKLDPNRSSSMLERDGSTREEDRL